MYQIGELIIYGSEGICKVNAISTPDIKGIDPNRGIIRFLQSITAKPL